MCIPCFPFSDIEFEDERRQKKGAEYQYVWNGQNWVLQPYSRRHRNTGGVAVPVQAGTIAAHPVTGPIQGIVQQQPYGQPVMMVAAGQPVPQGGHMVQQPVMVAGAPQIVAGNVTPGFPRVHADPVLGIGHTGAEMMAEQVQFAHENGLFEPQDFKPADDDPSKFYMVRELDGIWTQRNRATIDFLKCRWFLADEGYMYAVRLPEN